MQTSPETQTSNPFDLAGRVVIITGASKGLGKIYALRCAEAGARVVIADIDRAASAATQAEIEAAGGTVLSYVTDVTDSAATQALAQATLAQFGRIDALINNASLMSELPRRNWMEIPIEEWERVMAVNLRGIFLCCRAVYPAMQRRKKGKIVNISSSRVWEGTPNRLHYTTSKAGVIGFTRALAREVGDDNICVNAITPGFTLSESQQATTAAAYASDQDKLRSFKRAQLPGDLVGTVIFLLSDASDFITGQTINVDGGKAMH